MRLMMMMTTTTTTKITHLMKNLGIPNMFNSKILIKYGEKKPHPFKRLPKITLMLYWKLGYLIFVETLVLSFELGG